MEKLEEAHKFKLWKKHLIKNGLKINQITEEFTRRNRNGEVLFSLLLLDAETPEGDKIPPICFLKGEVVTVLVCLIDQDNKEKHLLLVKQRRIAEGGLCYEHPAGMVDNTQTPLDIAVKEVKEETGVSVLPTQLKQVLKEQRIFPSTGTSDECMYFFYTELYMHHSEINELNHKRTGVASEHERITTEILPFAEGHQLINNSNSILLSMAYLMDVEDWDLLKKLKV